MIRAHTAPLQVSGTNARYLIDPVSGAPVMLFGFHTWYSAQDGGTSNPPTPLDWDEYLAALVSYGCNFTKLWAMETNRGWSDTSGQWYDPVRYTRTGPGTANDGYDKVDLTQINQVYLDRLRTRVLDCAANGIYVCVQLFQGWQIEVNKGGTGDPCAYHPYLAANNINSLDGDDDNDGELLEIHWPSAQGNNVLAYQEALVEAIIDKLNDLDNIIWEISNEDTSDGDGYDTAWQEYMIDHIHTYEATKPKQHPVMMSWQYTGGSNTNLDNSDSDVVSYGANDTAPLTDPFTPTTKPNMFDTDHCGGLTAEYKWMWMAFCRGNGGLWYMDEWDGALYGNDRRETAAYMLIRSNLGYANTLYAMLNNLLLMTPQAALSSSGFCLARDHATAGEYICYYDGSSTFTLDLTNATGTLNVRWLRCSDGTVQDSATVSGGDVRTLTPPWNGAVVAYVRHT